MECPEATVAQSVDLFDWPVGTTLVVLRHSAVVGFLYRKLEGWKFYPQASSSLPSRKFHALAYDACRRRVGPNDRVLTRAAAVAQGILKGDN